MPQGWSWCRLPSRVPRIPRAYSRAGTSPPPAWRGGRSRVSMLLDSPYVYSFLYPLLFTRFAVVRMKDAARRCGGQVNPDDGPLPLRVERKGDHTPPL